MKTDDREPSADLQKLGNDSQGPLQVSEFIVDSDPQGLKDARGRVDRPPFAGDALADEFRELSRGFDRCQLAGVDDSPGHSPAVPFLAVFVKQIGEFLFLQRVDEIGRGGTIGIGVEPHVERAVVGEAEASIVPGKLVGGEPQVQQEPVDSSQSQGLQDNFDFAVRRVRQSDIGLTAGRDRGQGQHR